MGETATVVFTVSLDRPRPALEGIDVAHVKASDDEEESGTLRFERGDEEMTAGIVVHEETDIATVALTDADAIRITIVGEEATYDLGAGRDEKRALALKYILAATGRTIAANVVELVWERARSHRSGGGGSHAMLGGSP